MCYKFCLFLIFIFKIYPPLLPNPLYFTFMLIIRETQSNPRLILIRVRRFKPFVFATSPYTQCNTTLPRITWPPLTFSWTQGFKINLRAALKTLKTSILTWNIREFCRPESRRWSRRTSGRGWRTRMEKRPFSNIRVRAKDNWKERQVRTSLSSLKGKVAWDGFLASSVPHSVDRNNLRNFKIRLIIDWKKNNFSYCLIWNNYSRHDKQCLYWCCSIMPFYLILKSWKVNQMWRNKEQVL